MVATQATENYMNIIYMKKLAGHFVYNNNESIYVQYFSIEKLISFLVYIAFIQ